MSGGCLAVIGQLYMNVGYQVFIGVGCRVVGRLLVGFLLVVSWLVVGWLLVGSQSVVCPLFCSHQALVAGLLGGRFSVSCLSIVLPGVCWRVVWWW